MMTTNNRPIDDPKLQRALNECAAVFRRHGYAGAVMIISPDEAAFHYAMTAPWSAIRPDPSTQLGWRLRAKSREDGADVTHRRLEGALHTICQLADFGEQTTVWMEQIKAMVRRAGVEFDHVSFNGKPLPSIETEPRAASQDAPDGA